MNYKLEERRGNHKKNFYEKNFYEQNYGNHEKTTPATTLAKTLPQQKELLWNKLPQPRKEPQLKPLTQKLKQKLF